MKERLPLAAASRRRKNQATKQPSSKASKWAFLQMRGNGYGNMPPKKKVLVKNFQDWNRSSIFSLPSSGLLAGHPSLLGTTSEERSSDNATTSFSLLLGVVPNLISESHFYFSCAVTTEAASKARKLVVILELPSTTTHHTKKTSLCIRGKTISHQCFLCSKTP